MCAGTNEDHGLQNAQGWLETIKEMIAALNCDYERLAWLRDTRLDVATEGTAEELEAWDIENGEELADLVEAATYEGELQEDNESIRERIQEAPLSVQVRSDWHSPGEDSESAEFEILLTTGAPALRIIGDLGQHAQPLSPRLQYQDWGTPWTQLIVTGSDHDALQAFCECFYFGE